MIESIRKICFKYKEIILYGIFGVCTTIINILSFFVLDDILKCNMIFSNVIAWILAFIFAFVTNKLFVFESVSNTVGQTVKEFRDFFLARFATLFIDTFLMWLLVDVVKFNSMITKIVVNIIVILLNYIASKLWVFKEK